MNKSAAWAGVVLFVALGLTVPGGKTGSLGPPGAAGLAQPPDDGVVWVRRYDDPAHDSDVPRAIAVDDAGNVFVTGGSVVANHDWDFATVKYGPTGGQKWVRKYNFNTSAGSKVDVAYAMALDGAGTIYVTGESAGIQGFTEFATIKYDTHGNAAWTARSYWSGPLKTLNGARAIAVDSLKNVIAAGNTWLVESGQNTKHDFLTVKYDSGGHQMWKRRFDGTIHKEDQVVGVGVDLRRNVYVMGSSMEYGASGNLVLKHSDYRLVKYDEDGNVLWTIHRNSQGTAPDTPHAAMVIGRFASGFFTTEIFMTGSSKTNSSQHDFWTMKLDPNGNLRWAQTVSDVSGMTDIEALGLAVDLSGNVYVTGSALCPTSKFITIKYDPLGNLLWTRTYDAGLGNNYPTAIAVDGAGNVYVTGLSQSDNLSSFDYATVKYDTSGNEKWVRRYNGDAFGYDWPRAIAVDQSGYVYVTGSSKGMGSQEDFLTIKYQAD